jgi:hypothetical protein
MCVFPERERERARVLREPFKDLNVQIKKNIINKEFIMRHQAL